MESNHVLVLFRHALNDRNSSTPGKCWGRGLGDPESPSHAYASRLVDQDESGIVVRIRDSLIWHHKTKSNLVYILEWHNLFRYTQKNNMKTQQRETNCRSAVHAVVVNMV